MGLKPWRTGPAGDMLGTWSPSPGNQFLHLRSKVAQRGRKRVKSFMQPGEPALGPEASPSPWFTIHRMNKPKPAVLVSTLAVHIQSLDLHLASARLAAGLNNALEKFGTNPSVHTLVLLASLTQTPSIQPRCLLFLEIKKRFSTSPIHWLLLILQPLASLSISSSTSSMCSWHTVSFSTLVMTGIVFYL